jgi:hypothetical protein
MAIHSRRSTLATEGWRKSFYSINEASKPDPDRVHHNNNACVNGRPRRATPGHPYGASVAT